MKLSILSDEISSDPGSAAELAAEWGLKHFELRGWYRRRAPAGMSDEDMVGLRKTWQGFGLDCPSISPGLFKVRLDDPALEEHRGPFRERCFDLAEAMGARVVVCFPPILAEGEGWRDWPASVVEDLRGAAEAARARGLVLALENEPSCYGGCGLALAELVAEVGHPGLRANWDPGNHTHATGEDYREPYAALKPYHVHTHVKDYAGKGARAAPPGEGGVDWLGQLRALKKDGYKGLIVLETHFEPRIAGSQRCIQHMRDLLAQAGEEAE